MPNDISLSPGFSRAPQREVNPETVSTVYIKAFPRGKIETVETVSGTAYSPATGLKPGENERDAEF